jgi:hypothetical protein
MYTVVRILERYIKAILLNSGCKNNAENQNISGSVSDNVIQVLTGCFGKQGI